MSLSPSCQEAEETGQTMRIAPIVAFTAGLAACIPAAFADNLVSVNQAIAAAVARGGNASTINQVGSDNLAITDQTGSANSAAIGQFGNNNVSKITQSGAGGIAINNQYGNGNSLTITQTGPHPQPVIVTQRR